MLNPDEKKIAYPKCLINFSVLSSDYPKLIINHNIVNDILNLIYI